MSRKKFYSAPVKVQFLVEEELKTAFEKWCQENRTTMTNVFNQFMSLKLERKNSMSETPEQYQPENDLPFCNYDWDEVAGFTVPPVPEKSKALANFVMAWTISQKMTCPSTTKEEMAIALELVVKKLRGQ